jgi:hypothetical protein
MLFTDWVRGDKLPWSESDWLTSSDPSAMLDLLGNEASERKLRLFAVACCRRIWDIIPSGLHQQAVQLAEQYADGEVSCEEYKTMLKALEREYDDSFLESHAISDELERLRHFRYDTVSYQETTRWTLYRRWDIPWVVSLQAAHLRAGGDEAFDLEHGLGKAGGMTNDERERAMGEWRFRFQQERAYQSRLLRDLFGNPFRSIHVKATWLSDGVKRLARFVYEQRAYGEMPILADALEEAGCSEPKLLDHCRSAEEHVRGCWVIDLLLDKWGNPPPKAFSW